MGRVRGNSNSIPCRHVSPPLSWMHTAMSHAMCVCTCMHVYIHMHAMYACLHVCGQAPMLARDVYILISITRTAGSSIKQTAGHKVYRQGTQYAVRSSRLTHPGVSLDCTTDASVVGDDVSIAIPHHTTTRDVNNLHAQATATGMGKKQSL